MDDSNKSIICGNATETRIKERSCRQFCVVLVNTINSNMDICI